jgi:hypothetical protein
MVVHHVRCEAVHRVKKKGRPFACLCPGRLRKGNGRKEAGKQQQQRRRSANVFEFGYGHVVGVVVELRASGAVTGLLKSTELLLASVQLAIRITDRAFELVPETAIGAVSEQFAAVP